MADNVLDLTGIPGSSFQLGATAAGPKLKTDGTNFSVRNAADAADVEFTTSKLNVSGNVLVLNSDAAGSGADWKFTLSRPSSGMTAHQTWVFPATPGSAGQVLATDGSNPTNLSWVSAASTSACWTDKTTTINFGDTSPVALVTIPANAVVQQIRVIVDTQFDDTPTVSVGISGMTSKFMPAVDVNLTAVDGSVFTATACSGVVPSGSTQAVIATYSAASAAVGSARVIVTYSVPN